LADTGFETLVAINENWMKPGVQSPVHSHQDMEILTYVLEGAFEHRDHLGNRGIVWAGDLLRMTAGTGITHAEWNLSPSQPLHLLQVWVRPAQNGIEPDYEQRRVSDCRKGRFVTLASPQPRAGEIKLHQQVTLALAKLDPGARLAQPLATGTAYLHVIHGEICTAGLDLQAGDGLEIRNERKFQVETNADSELLLLEFA
jgi:hypothetical protein